MRGFSGPGVPWRIVKYLAEHPGARAANIAAALRDKSARQVTGALGQLERRGLVRGVGRGRERRYWSLVSDDIGQPRAAVFIRPGGIPSRILQHLERNPGATRSEVLRAMGDARRESVRTALGSLRDRGLVRVTGSPRNERYWSQMPTNDY